MNHFNHAMDVLCGEQNNFMENLMAGFIFKWGGNYHLNKVYFLFLNEEHIYQIINVDVHSQVHIKHTYPQKDSNIDR